MLIKASASLRNDYSSVSELARNSKEPIYITKNGEGDLVIMDIDTFEKREEILNLRAKILQAEEERLSGAKTLSTSEARIKLIERLHEI
jgi:prevent-host-death family protein